MKIKSRCSVQQRRHKSGFTLIEILVSLTLSIFIMSFLLELLLANQRSMKMQIALSTLETRMHRIASILRHDIHQAQGKVKVINESTLQVNTNTYLIDKKSFVVIDAAHRKFRLVGEVSDMHISQHDKGIDVSLHVAAGLVGKTIHVFTALK